jgi:DNA-directed RNA polymerase specialized sigma subunit
MKNLSTMPVYDGIKDYINGLALGFSKLKFAGVKVAVLNNLDALVLCDDDKKLEPIMKSILDEAVFQYEKFKESNMESFSFLKESPKIACLRMMKENKTQEEISNVLNISRSTYFRYKQVVLGEENKAKK